MLESTLDNISIGGKTGAPHKRFETVVGDKGYDGAPSRETISKRGDEPLIPHRKNPDATYPAKAEGLEHSQSIVELPHDVTN